MQRFGHGKFGWVIAQHQPGDPLRRCSETTRRLPKPSRESLAVDEVGGEPLDGARELGRLDDRYRSSERYLGDRHREPSENIAADSDDAVLCVILPQSVVGPPEDALDLGVRHVDDEGRSVIAGG